MQFTEQSPLETGFAAIFGQTVRPALMSIESQRVARLRKARRRIAMALGGAAALCALILLVFGLTEGGFFGVVFVLLFGVGGAWVIWQLESRGWGASVALAVMPSICAHVGDLTYDQSADGPFPTHRMRDLGLVRRYSKADLSDRLDGIYRDTIFEMVEAHLSRKTRDSKGRSKTKTVFRGLLFHIGVPVDIPAPILIARDRGGIGNALGALFSGIAGSDMQKVRFDHPEFESAFEVFSTDPGVARRFMPPRFLDSLLAIGETEGGRKGAKAMVAGFEGDSFYLALSRRGDFLKMGSLTTPVARMEDDLHAIFADIEMIHRIIDRLHGD